MHMCQYMGVHELGAWVCMCCSWCVVWVCKLSLMIFTRFGMPLRRRNFFKQSQCQGVQYINAVEPYTVLTNIAGVFMD